jgi:Uma2 family endonuclease
MKEPSALEVVELQNGDRMTRAEFHRLYERLPEDFKAELIGGVVYVASPLKRKHATQHPALSTALFLYAGKTPGVETGDHCTIQLGDESEPQPDLYLRILPEFGGQSHTSEDDYVIGAPELVAEIAYSSRAIDFHTKKADYATHGVREYLVVSLKDRLVKCFDLPAAVELKPGLDGILRSRAFPGLWLDPQALLAKDAARLVAVLEQGFATPEHAAFATQLKAAGPKPTGL